MDTETARGRLQELLTDLDRSERTLEAESAGDSGELSHYDQHQAESATQLADADREEAVLEVVRTQREEVLAALGRIDAGSYGRCVDCGAQLPDERLDARPEAARCVQCQQRLDARR